jgi:hypothetical protein
MGCYLVVMGEEEIRGKEDGKGAQEDDSRGCHSRRRGIFLVIRVWSTEAANMVMAVLWSGKFENMVLMVVRVV